MQRGRSMQPQRTCCAARWPMRPHEGSIRLAAGAFLVRAGKYEEAIPLLKEALALEAIEAHRYLADAYDALGQHEESRAHREAYKAVTETRVRQGAPIQ